MTCPHCTSTDTFITVLGLAAHLWAACKADGPPMPLPLALAASVSLDETVKALRAA